MSDNIDQDIAISGSQNIVVGKGDIIINPLPPAEARLRHDLGILLKNVETTWIKGVLEKSVHDTALLELGMELRAEAVDNPWRMVIEGPNQPREMLERGRKIKDIFEEANRLLLILGEPGAGKTTTLLQLARDLIAEVDQTFTQPVPVILNLSTWTSKQQHLDDWLITELNSKYHVPKKDGQNWLRERRILPLLDGLDEVKAEIRGACVEKINRLVSDYGLPGLVVCSRIKDYGDLKVRLAFHRAIYIQPLTTQQVDEFLQRVGEKLASLRATLLGDKALQNMAQSPLILNIMSLAYQDISAEALADPSLNTSEARRQHLFNTYIARMFSRKAGARQYDDNETKQRLAWLARNMQRHNQEVFLIEGLQPSWLLMLSWQWLYFVISRLVNSFVIGWYFYSDWPAPWTSGFIVGLSVGLIDTLRYIGLRKWGWLYKSLSFWWVVINIIIVWLIIGLLGGPIFGSIGDLTTAMGWGLGFGLIFGIRGSRQGSKNDIQTTEALQWSWRKALKGGLIGLLIAGLVLAPGYLLIHRGEDVFQTLSWILEDWLWQLTVMAPTTLSLGIIFYGLNSRIIETKFSPNQGIRLSIRNAIFAGVIVFVSYWLIVVLVGQLSGLLDVGLSSEIVDNVISEILVTRYETLLFSLIGVFWYGGFDVIQHYTLRLLLTIQGHIPANYARFLDYGVDRIFLQKLGGGYRFIHRLLLEHFADLYETKEQDSL